MSVDDLVHQMTRSLQREGNARSVFLQAVKLDTCTVIPVAKVRLAAGGGSSKSRESGAEIQNFGGGLGLDVSPVGFIHESRGEVVFTAIPSGGSRLPLLGEAAIAGGRLVTVLVGFLKSRVRRTPVRK